MQDEMNKLLQSDDESPKKKEVDGALEAQVRKFPSGQQIGQRKVVHDMKNIGADESKKTTKSWAETNATASKTSVPAQNLNGKQHLRAALMASRGGTASTQAGTPV